MNSSIRKCRPGVEALEDRLLLTFDAYLSIRGLEDRDPPAREHIQLESWSFGQTPASIGNTSDFHFVMKMDQASAALFQRYCTGQHYPKVILTLAKAEPDPQAYMKIKMTDCFISSYQMGGSSGTPTDSFSINFTKVRTEYPTGKSAPDFWVLRDGMEVNFMKTKTFAGDVNGDGRADMFHMRDMNGDKRREMVGAIAGYTECPSDPSKIEISNLARPANQPPNGPRIEFGDHDGDGFVDSWDLIFPGGQRIRFLDPDENGIADGVLVDGDGNGKFDMGIADLDGDGIADEAWMDRNGDGAMQAGEMQPLR